LFFTILSLNVLFNEPYITKQNLVVKTQLCLVSLCTTWLFTYLVGPFVTGLEYSCDCKAEVVGKPEATFFHSAIKDLDVSPGDCVMIGDVSIWFYYDSGFFLNKLCYNIIKTLNNHFHITGLHFALHNDHLISILSLCFVLFFLPTVVEFTVCLEV